MQLAYSRHELLSEHDYHRRHVISDREFHGGFDADDRYLSPRSKRRSAAIRNWSRALRARGGDLHPIDFDLNQVEPYPSPAQNRRIIAAGRDDLLWNFLTQTGRAEARGRDVIAALEVPDFQGILAEDIRQSALGHLGGGLLEAHALDEGGSETGVIGAHDEMWFMVRDLAMGEDKYPLPAPPQPSPERTPTRRIPEIPEATERFVRFLMVLLIAEVRAFQLFDGVRELLTPELFPSRSQQAHEATNLVARIRQEEAIHVSGLRVVLGELYHATFLTPDGPRPGRELFAPVWPIHVQFLNVTVPAYEADAARRGLPAVLGSRPGGKRLVDELAALDVSA